MYKNTILETQENVFTHKFVAIRKTGLKQSLNKAHIYWATIKFSISYVLLRCKCLQQSVNIFFVEIVSVLVWPFNTATNTISPSVQRLVTHHCLSSARKALCFIVFPSHARNKIIFVSITRGIDKFLSHVHTYQKNIFVVRLLHSKILINFM